MARKRAPLLRMSGLDRLQTTAAVAWRLVAFARAACSAHAAPLAFHFQLYAHPVLPRAYASRHSTRTPLPEPCSIFLAPSHSLFLGGTLSDLLHLLERLAELGVTLNGCAHSLQHGVNSIPSRWLQIAWMELSRRKGSDECGRLLKAHVASIIWLPLDHQLAILAEGEHGLSDNGKDGTERHVPRLAKGLLHLALHVGLAVEEEQLAVFVEVAPLSLLRLKAQRDGGHLDDTWWRQAGIDRLGALEVVAGKRVQRQLRCG
mmetsp:Transcript_35894/g.94360  ORF Transcript_35894/g.94360 Transcript_35894/m.94360 type:complete len:260 (-) Transcript_35894:1832-2611(-)